MSSAARRAHHEEFSWLGLEAPRYTSYPSAHHFNSQVTASQHTAWLASIDSNTTLSVYVHIPFCRELCWFCGCHTKMTKRYEPVSRYVQVLLEEIRHLGNLVGSKGKLVNLNFGGGSPSLLEANDLLAILYGIREAFGENAGGELAIELDPRTTTQENISFYASLGFNRVSIGIQDFSREVQRAINRIEPYEMVASVVQGLRQSGIMAINCDLVYGLPFQTRERFLKTLEQTVSLNPSRIALFSYAHMPQIKKHQRLIDSSWLPAPLEKLELYTIACRFLEENSYVTIGIDHFAKPDDPLAIAMRNHSLKRNFMGYVTNCTDALIGIGSSAISQFPEGYIQNSADTSEYSKLIGKGGIASVRGWNFREDDAARKHIIDELMCFMSVDVDETCRHFGLKRDYFASELGELASDSYSKIINCEGGKVRLTTPHRMAARIAAAVFDRYRHLASGRYSKVA